MIWRSGRICSKRAMVRPRRFKLCLLLSWGCLLFVFYSCLVALWQFRFFEGTFCRDCHQVLQHYLINPRTRCTNANAKSLDPQHYQDLTYEPYDMIVMVITRPSSFETRAVLRRTLLTESSLRMTHVFLLGKPADPDMQLRIYEESRQYDDIVQQSFMDHYYSLTNKTQMGLQWAVEHCRRARFILKVDEDVFINITRMMSIINSVNDNQNYIYGSCLYHSAPYRDPSSPYYISYEVFPYSEYPPFCRGPAYVISMEIARSIRKHVSNTPYYHLEDVYMAMCLWKTPYSVYNVDAVTHVQFRSGMTCTDLQPTITVHMVNSTVIEWMWNKCR